MEKSLYKDIQEVENSHWWYKARREIVFHWLTQILQEKSKPWVLDIGCGTGFNVDQLQQLGYNKTIGLDRYEDALSFCQSRQVNYLVQADAGFVLPFSDKSIDVILALDVIEHIEDDTKFLEEIYRCLMPGGSLIIFTPAFMFLWSFQDTISYHYRRYTRQEIMQKAQAVGFKINKLTYVNSFLFPIVWIGRQLYKFFGNNLKITSESQLSPSWMNGILYKVFAAELLMLDHFNFPVGVSIFCICEKTNNSNTQVSNNLS